MNKSVSYTKRLISVSTTIFECEGIVIVKS
jgi:hypothetical protein